MTEILCIIFALPLIANSLAWVLEANVDEITPGTTKDVMLVCKNDFSKPINAEIQTILNIRIFKVLNGTSQKVAEYSTYSGETFKRENDTEVSANINMKDLTYLQLMWPTANEKTSGRYGCEVEGYDADDNFLSLKTSEKHILEKPLTMEVVRKYVASVTLNYETKQRMLESEITTLKSQLSNVQQKCQDDIENTRVDISKMQRHINLTYSTKDELSSKVSELEKLIGNNSFEDNGNCMCNHKNCCSMIHETRDGFSRQLKNLTNDINKLEKKRKEADNQTESKFEKFKDLLDKLNENYLLLNKNVKRLNDSCHERSTALPTLILPSASPTLEPDAIPTTKPTRRPITTLTKWPDGTYALVKPPSGCPHFANVEILKYIHFFLPSEDADLSYINLPKYELQSEWKHKAVQLCLQIQRSEMSSMPREWPEGSYCINQYRGMCPTGFQGGRILQRVRSSRQDIGFFSVPYCCRNDGDPDKSVKLPVERPFYLYRYKGKCQKVDDMHIIEDRLTVDSSGPKPYSTSLTSNIPDTNEQGYPINLCYYKPYQEN